MSYERSVIRRRIEASFNRRDSYYGDYRGERVTYFIGDSCGNVKIGTTTTGGVIDRVKALQTANPNPLRLLGVFRAKEFKEKALHAMFENCRIRGEWFSLFPDISGFLAENMRNNLARKFIQQQYGTRGGVSKKVVAIGNESDKVNLSATS